MVWVFGGIAAFAALAYGSAFCWRHDSALKTAVKTTSTAALAMAAWWGGAPGLLVAALVASAFGDFALSRPSERMFLAGMASFALGHGAYIGLFVQTGAHPAALGTVVPALLAAGLVGAAIVAGRRFVSGAGALAAPVAVYAGVICLMGLAALALGSGHLLVQSAAFAFVASDMILGEQLFGINRGRWADRLLWLLYWGAQALFVLAFLP
ncbi:lysoplasmalogenase [Mesobacterium sp. TK19101]|uniref:Lysoplasmalogenase n=1 Tax=Mesobacterium hydrothermale TaxID=3111907 RepID=A0ABU6HM59_9RHOB|nr:lysoplasmalogenase [Mesobacterium sp. TK19101]MEC3862265.1 lysoplasmalogenase [Mesobacterium sp. TK19101]